MLPRTYPVTLECRRALEVLSKAGGLSAAQTVESSVGDVIGCAWEVGRYNRQEGPKDSEPGGRYQVNASIGDDSSAYSYPHVSS